MLYFLPLSVLAGTVLRNCNDLIVALGGPELVWGDFLLFLGFLALVATLYGFKRDDFWSIDHSFDQHHNHCPYRFTAYISKRRFDIVMREFCWTGILPPHFADKFWQVLDLVTAFNTHMASMFLSSWVICVEESM